MGQLQWSLARVFYCHSHRLHAHGHRHCRRPSFQWLFSSMSSSSSSRARGAAAWKGLDGSCDVGSCSVSGGNGGGVLVVAAPIFMIFVMSIYKIGLISATPECFLPFNLNWLISISPSQIYPWSFLRTTVLLRRVGQAGRLGKLARQRRKKRKTDSTKSWCVIY